MGDESKVIDYLMSDNSQTQNFAQKSNVSSGGDKKSLGVTAFDYQDNININTGVYNLKENGVDVNEGTFGEI